MTATRSLSASSGCQDGVAERVGLLAKVRAGLVLLVLLGAAMTPDVTASDRLTVAALALGPLVATSAGLAGSRGASGRSAWPRLLPVLLVGGIAVDAAWLAATIAVSGGAGSPVLVLGVLHVASVALVLGQPAAAVTALGHAVLVCAVLLPGAGVSSERVRVALLVVVLVTAGLGTAALVGVRERGLRRRSRDLERLAALAEGMRRADDAAHLARLLLASAGDTLEAGGLSPSPRAAVLAGPDGQLALLASQGLSAEVVRRPGRPGPCPVARAALATRSTQVLPRPEPRDEPWLTRLMPGASVLLVVPLQADGRPRGVLVLERPQGPDVAAGAPVGREVVAVLERSAAYAALALDDAWLLEQVHRLAATDGLTKIANRRTFESTLEREVARSVRSGEPVSLVMVDLDDFKALNDTHGHQAGDEVLRNVAAALAIECRDFDTAARYGGEEFAVVLPGCGPDEALQIAERLRTAVARAPSAVPVTASAGVASYPAQAGDADSLVRAADAALYASKSAGRDRTTSGADSGADDAGELALRRAVVERLGRRPTGSGSTDRPDPSSEPATRLG